MSEPIINYYASGKLWEKLWINENNNLHNENGPAFIGYYETGKIYNISYYINNTMHRINGPSRILYYQNGKIIEWNWFYKGIHYTKKVENWFKNNDINYKKMNENDYNRMWFEIL